MISIQKVVAVSFAGAAALLIGSAAMPTPAEAGKLGATITKAAMKASVKSVARSGRRGDRDEDDTGSVGSSRATNKVDPDERAAMAKAKLDAEKAEAPPPSVASLSAPVGPTKGVVCLAGC